MNDILLRS